MENQQVNKENLSNSYIFIHITQLFYGWSFLFIFIEGYIPGIVQNLLWSGFVVFWLGFPVALYFDRKYVAMNSGWEPSKLYYFGFLPSIVGFCVIWIYIRRRVERMGKVVST